jgi:hypothetical protein
MMPLQMNDDEATILRRRTTSAMGDMVCSMWPAHAHLRDEANHLRSLREAYKAADNDERDRLSGAIVASCERMMGLVDLIAEQM